MISDQRNEIAEMFVRLYESAELFLPVECVSLRAVEKSNEESDGLWIK